MKKVNKLLHIMICFFMFLISLNNISYSSQINEDTIKAPLELTRRAKTIIEDGAHDEEIYGNQFSINEEFEIEYNIKPQNIPLEKVVSDSYFKEKEIVLVMDISDSMNETINYNSKSYHLRLKGRHNSKNSFFDDKFCAQNVTLQIKEGCEGDSIDEYGVTFDEPKNGTNKKTRYLFFYSKDEIDIVADKIKELSKDELYELDFKYNRANWINYSNKTFYFNSNQMDIDGNPFDSNCEYNVYVATIKISNSHSNSKAVIGLSKAIGFKEKKIEVMKEVAKEFLKVLRNDERIRVSLVPYQSYATNYHYNNSSFAKLSDSNKYYVDGKLMTAYEDLINDIDNLKADGGTNIGDGLRNAYYKLTNNENINSDKYIILMTDGEPTAYSWIYKDIFGWEYYLGSNDNYYYAPLYGNDYKRGFSYSKLVAENLIANSEININSFFISFSNEADRDKLAEIAELAGGYYKHATDGNALEELYLQLARQIESELPIHSIYFEETFPEGIQPISVENVGNNIISLVVNGQTVSGDIGGISYLLNEETEQYEAGQITFKIKVKASDIGNYILDKSAYIKFIDLDEEETVKEFPEINIDIFENEPPLYTTIFEQGIFVGETQLRNANQSINIISGYKVNIGIKFICYKNIENFILNLNKNKISQISKIEDISFRLFEVRNNTLIEKIDLLEYNEINSELNSKKYDILLYLNKDNPPDYYILVYSFKPQTTSIKESLDVIFTNSVEINGNTLDLILNIKPLPKVE